MPRLHDRPRRSDLPVLLAIVSVCLGLSLRYSDHRPMWLDELLGWQLVTDPSFPHMLRAWRHGADGGGILFYLPARAWLHFFGATPTALRLFSATGVAVAASCTYLLARERTSRTSAAVATLIVFFSSDTVLWQLLQARFYGLLLAGVALSVLLLTRLANRQHLSVADGLTLLLSQSLLVGSHPFGLVYSAALLLALTLRSALTRASITPLPWALAGWWILLPSLPAMRASAAVAQPHFWTTPPHLPELLATYTAWSLPTAILLGTSLFLTLLALRLRPAQAISAPSVDPLPWLLSALLLLPVILFIKSQFGLALFVDRYLLPSVVPLTLILAACLHRLSRLWPTLRPRLPAHLRQTIPPAVYLALAVAVLWTTYIAVVAYPAYARYPSRNRRAELQFLTANLPTGIPILVEPVDLFAELVAQPPRLGLQFVTVLDWQQATGPHALRGEVTAFHEMQNWRRAGYFAPAILDLDPLLHATTPFLVLDIDSLQWFEDHLAHNPRFTSRLLCQARLSPNDTHPMRVWLVTPVA